MRELKKTLSLTGKDVTQEIRISHVGTGNVKEKDVNKQQIEGDEISNNNKNHNIWRIRVVFSS